MSKSNFVHTFEINEKGRDFAVGDIHGHFTRLEKALARIGFDKRVDRLFSVGDLVDRGPESDKVLWYLRQPWFHAVRGNHEDMAIRWPNGGMDAANYASNGGGWNVANLLHISRAYAYEFSELPLAINIATASGQIGIVHADCPFATWREFIAALEDDQLTNKARKMVFEHAMWSRERLMEVKRHGVLDMRAVVVGHTPLQEAAILGNVYFIDTGGWRNVGHFTFLELDSLKLMPTPTDRLEWEAVCPRN